MYVLYVETKTKHLAFDVVPNDKTYRVTYVFFALLTTVKFFFRRYFFFRRNFSVGENLNWRCGVNQSITVLKHG